MRVFSASFKESVSLTKSDRDGYVKWVAQVCFIPEWNGSME